MKLYPHKNLSHEYCDHKNFCVYGMYITEIMCKSICACQAWNQMDKERNSRAMQISNSHTTSAHQIVPFKAHEMPGTIYTLTQTFTTDTVKDLTSPFLHIRRVQFLFILFQQIRIKASSKQLPDKRERLLAHGMGISNVGFQNASERISARVVFLGHHNLQAT